MLSPFPHGHARAVGGARSIRPPVRPCCGWLRRRVGLAWASAPFHLRVEVLDTSSETGVLAALKAIMAQYPGLFQGEPALAYRGD